jgi:hypothetical protein
MEINLVLAYYDFWIGIFWDRKKRDLYILPIPMIGIRIHFHKWNFQRKIKRPVHPYGTFLKSICDCDEVLYKEDKPKTKWKWMDV